MPNPTEHKTVRAHSLKYAKTIGRIFVYREGKFVTL